ncbi:uncharacterized protein TNCV_3806121 [Trichonephila clavipes]|nr:uncharacterized protein TNCV_3806121 [Trichonephila clavipes]
MMYMRIQHMVFSELYISTDCCVLAVELATDFQKAHEQMKKEQIRKEHCLNLLQILINVRRVKQDIVTKIKPSKFVLNVKNMFAENVQWRRPVYVKNAMNYGLKNSTSKESDTKHPKKRLNINQENWISHLLGLLPTEVSHIIAREPDDKANSYEHVKDLLLKRFKLTPEKFRQLFVTHQKAPERTWIDFYHEFNTYFNGWIDGLKIDTFDKLSDLIITDQLKRKTPFEFKEYYLDEWANINSPVQLAEKLEEFEDFKRTLKQKSSSPFVKKQEFKSTEKNRRYTAPGKFEYNRKDKKFPASTNYNKHYEAPVSKYESVQRYQDSAQKGRRLDQVHEPKSPQEIVHQKRTGIDVLPFKSCTKQKMIWSCLYQIAFSTILVKITALIDSGSTVSLLRENTSRRIMDPTKLSKNKMLLTGIGEAQVTTIGSFEHEFEIDNENYSLTWHVVPADKLKFEAVIGSDVLEQASIS